MQASKPLLRKKEDKKEDTIFEKEDKRGQRGHTFMPALGYRLGDCLKKIHLAL